MASKNDYVKNKKQPLIIKLVKVIIAIIILFLMIGLKNSVEINHLVFVNAIGIDKSTNNDNQILITLQILPPQLTSSSSSSQSKVYVTSISEDSIEEAISKVQNYISAAVNFSHTRAIIISKDLAKNGVERYLNAISSNPILDTNMYLIVCDGTAKEYLETLSKDTEINQSQYFNIIKNSEKFSGSTKSITVSQFLKSIYSPLLQPSTSVCRVFKQQEAIKQNVENKNNSADKTQSSTDNNLKIEVGGTAIFKKDKLIGITTTDETAYHIMLTSKIKNYDTSISIKNTKNKSKNVNKEDSNIDNEEDKTTAFNINITQYKEAKINVNISTIKPTIDITIPLNVIVLDTKSGEYDYFNKEYMDNIKRGIKEELGTRINNYLTKLQTEYQVDTEGFSKYVKSKFLTQKDLDEYKWDEKFKDAKINLTLDIDFTSSGLDVKK